MSEPNFEAIGKVNYYKDELNKAHEKRRKWAHEITDLVQKLREPSDYRGDAGVLDAKALDSACEELKRLSVEVEEYRALLNEAKGLI